MLMVGPERYYARFPRVGHGLKRLVAIGSDGMVTLAALRWLADQNAAFVMLERDGKVLATTGPVFPSDSRLRRAQALARQSGIALPIAKELIRQKLIGQEQVLAKHFPGKYSEQVFVNARTRVDDAKSTDEIRLWEGQAAKAYWGAWHEMPITFPKADLPRVPNHWQKFGNRISPITSSPRRAVNPPNSMLNFLYSLLESEARLALATLGLDPGIGFLHNDLRTRDSLAADVMEPIRPKVDAFLLDWLRHTPIRREWFFEQRDGNCRLMSALAITLSETANIWARALAPFAEGITRSLWTKISKANNRRSATPLTGDQRRAGRGGQLSRPAIAIPKVPRICKVCGISCEKTYCASCGSAHSRKEFDKGRLAAQSPKSLARRSDTQKAHVLAIRAWKPSKEFAWLNKKAYTSKIQPHLISVTVPAIMAKLSVSEPYASSIRSGRCIPHQRHWLPLAELTGCRQRSV
jgi:CRISPR-associated endonuclease Cas1